MFSLSEINETHLGLSKGISKGKGVGQIGAERYKVRSKSGDDFGFQC